MDCAFKVNPHVLIPRPETELLIETAIRYQPFAICDVGTGSGIIAITLATKLNDAEIFATDISEEALKVSKENAQRHGVADRIKFIHGDLLERRWQSEYDLRQLAIYSQRKNLKRLR